jgi:hypothetical protein
MDKSYADLLKENDLLKKENDKKDRIIEKLQKTVEELALKVKQLNNELHKYMNENTPSGAIPPHLKKLEKIVNENSKEEDDKLPKENHRNSRPEQIDRNEHHSLENPICPKCGGQAKRRGTSTRKRIVIEMQFPKAETVEHESDIYQCNECNKIFLASIPNAIPKTEFDITTTIFISYLFTAAKMSVGDIKDLLHLFGINISEGSITNSMKRLKSYLGPYYEELL